MASATIIKAWQDTAGTHLVAMVAEGGALGNVEYLGTVDNATFNALPDIPTKKAALVAAVKAVRDAQFLSPTTFGTITGAVTV